MKSINHTDDSRKWANDWPVYTEVNDPEAETPLVKRSARTSRRKAKAQSRQTLLASLVHVLGWIVVIVWVSVWGARKNPAPSAEILCDPVQSVSEALSAPNTAAGEASSSSVPPWNLMLINAENPLPDNYTVKLADVPGGEKVDERIYDPLMELLDAASAEGLGPIVVSGYRTSEKQQNLYDQKIQKYQSQGYSKAEAIEMAEQWVAKPGTSEHQSGLAVDINGATYDIYLWLQENSYKYGFVFRYPGNKTAITGVSEEVWHYRYVGTDAARDIYEQGICLEEYVNNPSDKAAAPDETPAEEDVWYQEEGEWHRYSASSPI